MVLGFELFDPELTLAAVVLNRVASARHYAMLKTAIETSCRTPVLGWLPREEAIAIPERHLGLQTAEESAAGEELEMRIDRLASLAEEHVDIASLMALECGLDLHEAVRALVRPHDSDVRVGCGA